MPEVQQQDPKKDTTRIPIILFSLVIMVSVAGGLFFFGIGVINSVTPTEEKCHFLNTVDMIDPSNSDKIESLKLECTKDETGWHLNYTKIYYDHLNTVVLK